MKIIGLNQNIIWKNITANKQLIVDLLKNQEADVFLLPEMFTTGFCMDAEEIADPNEETLQWMKALAKEKNAAIGGSISVKEHGKFFNRFYFVLPNGTHEQYDKRHLFSYSGEDKIYTKGNERVIVHCKGFRVLLQTCYDLRFPVFMRNKGDYDAVFFVANWPETRIEAWKTLLKARAIENQCFVFGVNRIGTDGNNLNYPESSYSFFADGREISEVKESIVTSVWNLEELNLYREKFPFLKDQDCDEAM
ncbi:MAG: nitrilase family protein [Cloacibacterium sp.]|nr:nitrilase family protein [Cloacibacterium sp.]